VYQEHLGRISYKILVLDFLEKILRKISGRSVYTTKCTKNIWEGSHTKICLYQIRYQPSWSTVYTTQVYQEGGVIGERNGSPTRLEATKSLLDRRGYCFAILGSLSYTGEIDHRGVGEVQANMGFWSWIPRSTNHVQTPCMSLPRVTE
jgi:hypothetical protein